MVSKESVLKFLLVIILSANLFILCCFWHKIDFAQSQISQHRESAFSRIASSESQLLANIKRSLFKEHLPIEPSIIEVNNIESSSSSSSSESNKNHKNHNHDGDFKQNNHHHHNENEGCPIQEKISHALQDSFNKEMQYIISNVTIWSGFLPKNLFQPLDKVIRVNFVPAAKQLSTLTNNLATAAWMNEYVAGAGDILKIISQVSNNVAQLTPITNDPTVQLIGTNITVLGDIIEGIPQDFLDTVSDTKTLARAAENCAVLAERLAVDWSGIYQEPNGNFKQWDANRDILNVLRVVENVCTFIYQGAASTPQGETLDKKPSVIEQKLASLEERDADYYYYDS